MKPETPLVIDSTTGTFGAGSTTTAAPATTTPAPQ
jgi:hypothetical protein